MKLWTIGYEAQTQTQVIERLKAAGVERLVDVRAVAASRRAGFSKTVLGASLQAEGIEYLHLRALGTPKAGREAARAGRPKVMEAIYADHLAEPDAQLELARLRDLAAERKTALLCYEADPGQCHRTILARQLASAEGFELVEL